MQGKKRSMTASAMGKKGGKARVPKGLALVSPARRSEIGKIGAAARWGKPTHAEIMEGKLPKGARNDGQ